MGSRRYSGYLADDESLRGPQLRHVNPSQEGDPCDWRNLLRPPSRCQFREQYTSTTASELRALSPNKGKRKQRSSSRGESSHLANEFSEFVDFLADEEVLESLQNIVEDAVRKLRRVTTEDGDPLFDVEEESGSSMDSKSWSFSCSSQSRYYTTTASSSSEDDWEACLASRRESMLEGKMSLLDKYASRLPRLEERPREEVSARFHTETFSERSGENYYFRQEHFHIWAKLAESFPKLRPPHRDYFAKFRKPIPKQTMSVESLHKEITSVLKRPTPSSIPLYYPGNEPFAALDFLEENKILAALQSIINQAVLKVLEVTMTDGIPFITTFDAQGHPLLPWESSVEESEEGEELMSGSGDSESGEGSSEEGDSKSEEGKEGVCGKKKKKKKKRGKKKKDKGKEKEKDKEKDKERRKKKGKEESLTPSPEEKAKPKYTPPPLPKSKRKSMGPEETPRKPKYVPPPLPKTKPRPPPEEPPPKPKYVPPPLPKPRQKKDTTAAAAEPKQPAVSRRIISPSDIKRARLQGKPLPKQAIIEFLIENAAKLILYKYNYETLLNEKLGFISVPVTKVLLEIMFGYKRVKGSGIRLSSQIDWSKVHDEIYAPRKPKPKPPKQKDKKKGKKKKVLWDLQKKSGEKKSVLFKAEMPTGKVVVTKTIVEKEVKSSKMQKMESTSQQEGSQGTDIFDIIPFADGESEEAEFVDGEELSVQSAAFGSSRRSVTSEGSKSVLPVPNSEDQSPTMVTPKASSSQKLNFGSDETRGSGTVLPEVGAPSQNSEELLKKVPSSRRSSLSEEGSKTLLPKI